MLNEIINSPIFIIIFDIIAIIGFILEVKQQIQKSKPTYTKMTKSYISNECEKFKELSMHYCNKKIRQFSVTTIAFWNGGKHPLKREDYDNIIPYITTSNNCDILDYSINDDFHDNKFVQLSSELKDNKIYFNFKNISKKQGFVVSIKHTGNSNEDILVNFKFCNIKEKNIFIFKKSRHTSIWSKIFNCIVYLVTLMMLLCIVLSFVVFGKYVTATLYSLFAIFCAIILFNDMVLEQLIPYKSVPKRFRKHFYNIDH